MMKKNFLGKFMVLAAMIYAGFTLSSCDEKDNPSGNNWTELKVTNKTATSATVTANSASEVNSLIASLSKDIKAAVTDGKDYTITIDVPSLKTTKTDHTISLPAPASGEDGGTLILYIKNSFSTDGTPLVVKSNETKDWVQWSNSKAEILLPAGTSDIDLEINMSHTTVTIDSKGNATIDKLVALTGYETLIIENGITVNWLNIKGGRGILKKGGKILGKLIEPGDYQNISVNGIRLNGVYENEIPEEPTVDDLVVVKKAKVVKSDDDAATPISRIFIDDTWEEPKDIAEVEVILEEGVKAIIDQKDVYWNPYRAIVNITGEGDGAEIVSRANSEEDGIHTGMGLQAVNKLSNVTIDISTGWNWNDEKGKYEEVEADVMHNIDMPQNSEDCIFKAPRFGFKTRYTNNSSASYKNCTFKRIENDEDPMLDVQFPVQTKKRTSFDLTFDTCTFDKVFKFGTGFFAWSEEEWSAYDGYKAFITLENTKMAGKAVTNKTEMIEWIDNIIRDDKVRTTTLFVIDDVTYKPVNDEGKWILLEVK